MKYLAMLAFFLVLLISTPAYAVYFEIPASTVDQAFILNIDPNTWIKITLKNMVANRSMDNIALTFRDPQLNELFHIFIKTSGEIWYSYQSPVYLGRWRNDTEIYIGFYGDKVVLSIGYPSSSNKTEMPVPITRVYDVRVHSNDDRNRAYVSGTIVIERTNVFDIGETVSGITGSFYSLIPLIFTIVSVAIPLMIARVILKTLSKVF